MSAIVLKRSGAASGLQEGEYFGSYTSKTFGGKLIDYFESMENACLPGDSGGPVYYTYRDRNKIVGIVMGNGTIGDTQLTAYIPCSQIKSKLGVEPLEN